MLLHLLYINSETEIKKCFILHQTFYAVKASCIFFNDYQSAKKTIEILKNYMRFLFTWAQFETQFTFINEDRKFIYRRPKYIRYLSIKFKIDLPIILCTFFLYVIWENNL